MNRQRLMVPIYVTRPDQIKSLREFPIHFPEFDRKYDGLWQMHCGRHMVFYLVTDDAIEIIRVLREAMDFFRTALKSV
jgi:plasmid stabilization system protein ParE